MNDEREYMDNGHLDELITRFENFWRYGHSGYFDVDEFEDIIDYYSGRLEFDKLESLTDLAIKIHPGNSYFLLKKAELLFNRQKFAESQEVLNQIIKKEEYHFTARQMLALSYQETGNLDKAIAIFQKNIELGADEGDTWLNMAMAYERFNKFPLALTYLLRIIRHYPDDEHALYEILYCYEALEKHDEAITFFNRYVDEHPYSEAGWFNLGIAYSNNKEYEKAIEAYDFVLVIDDQYSSACFNKALALMTLERFDEALENFRLTREYEDEDPVTLFYIGRCHELSNREEKAIEYYNKSLNINSNQTEALLALAALTYNRNEKEKALRMLEDYVKSYDDEALPGIFLAILLLKNGQTQKAKYHLRRAAVLINTDEEALYCFFLYIHLREIKKASKILELQNYYFAPKERLALVFWVEKLLGRHQKAKEILQENDVREEELRTTVANLFSELTYLDYLNFYL